MPMKNFHSCRLENPDKYDRFTYVKCQQKHENKCIDVNFGWKKKEGKEVSEIQALRYDKDVWTADAARSHCKSRDGSFEAAKTEKSMDKVVESRLFPITELRMEGEGKEKKLTGYAAVFNVIADLKFFKEKIEPGAFADAIPKSDTRSLWNHDSNYVLGRKSSKTLRLQEDDHGLKVEIIPPDTQWARDLVVSIDRGDVREMSFGFIVKEDGDKWERDGSNPPVRTLKKNGIEELVDVSPVTFPAYMDTEIALRSLENWEQSVDLSIGDKREEDLLVKLGLLKEEDEDEKLRIIRQIGR